MRVFISWSGERSKALAKAVNEWLPVILPDISPWMSEAEIQAGQRWSAEISKELESSNFGIICVTPENLNAPWLLFEAGALSKSMKEAKVVPLLLGLNEGDVPFPLAQFQAKKVEKSGIKELIFDLNKDCNPPLKDNNLEVSFEALWKNLESKVKLISKDELKGKSSRNQSEILEELVASVRNVEFGLREGPYRESNSSRRRKRFHPMMLFELAESFQDRSNDPIFLLVLAGMYREDMPWLAEILTESYRDIRSGSGVQIEAASLRLRRLMKQIDRNHPIFREMMGDSKESHMMVMELPHIVERALTRFSDSLEKDDTEDLI